MERLSSRVVYENQWLRLREDRIRYPDGSSGVYTVVDKRDFTLVLPRADGGFWMVEQFRYPIGRRVWELPQGSWHGEPDGDALALARTELAEETGLTAGEWRHLGRLGAACGFASQHFDVWLATELVEGTPDREATEQDMVHRFVPDDELWAMVASGQVVDGHSLAGLALWQRAGHR